MSSRRRTAAILLAIAPPAALGAFVYWTLHHPKPTVIAPVPINRSSLLPHMYAGPCLNCHRIIETEPVAVNAGNMDSFRLSPRDRQLLLAGQRVDVPDLSQKLRIPAITRVQNLTHDYVGVCCNCHVILDVHPSPEFMNAAMRMARRPVFGPGVDPAATARGGAAWDPTRQRNRRNWGFVASAALLIAAGAIVARRWWLQTSPGSGDGSRSKAAQAVHGLAGAALCVAAALHWYYSDRGNNLLHLALVLLSGLSAGCVLLRYRLGAVNGGSLGALRFAQRLAFLVFLGLLVAGHLFSDLG